MYVSGPYRSLLSGQNGPEGSAMKTFLTFLMWTIVLAIGAVTAAANFRYGWLVGHGPERYIYAFGGTLLDVSKTFLPVMLGTFLPGRFTLGMFF